VKLALASDKSFEHKKKKKSGNIFAIHGMGRLIEVWIMKKGNKRRKIKNALRCIRLYAKEMSVGIY